MSPLIFRHAFDHVRLWNLFASFTEQRLPPNFTWPFTSFLLLTYQTDTASFENLRLHNPFKCRSAGRGILDYPLRHSTPWFFSVTKKKHRFFESGNSTPSLGQRFFSALHLWGKWVNSGICNSSLRNSVTVVTNMYYGSCTIRFNQFLFNICSITTHATNHLSVPTAKDIFPCKFLFKTAFGAQHAQHATLKLTWPFRTLTRAICIS